MTKINDDRFQQTDEARRQRAREAMRRPTAGQIGRKLIQLAAHPEEFAAVEALSKLAAELPLSREAPPDGYPLAEEPAEGTGQPRVAGRCTCGHERSLHSPQCRYEDSMGECDCDEFDGGYDAARHAIEEGHPDRAHASRQAQAGALKCECGQPGCKWCGKQEKDAQTVEEEQQLRDLGWSDAAIGNMSERQIELLLQRQTKNPNLTGQGNGQELPLAAGRRTRQAAKPGELQVGDLVKYTAKFMQSTGMYTGGPIDGKVVADGGSMGDQFVQVHWNDRDEPVMVNVANIMLKHKPDYTGSKRAQRVTKVAPEKDPDEPGYGLQEVDDAVPVGTVGEVAADVPQHPGDDQPTVISVKDLRTGRRAQQNPMEPSEPMPGQPGQQPGPGSAKTNPARTKEVWDEGGKFSREVEADGVDDLVRIHRELNDMGLTRSPESQQGQTLVESKDPATVQQGQAWAETSTAPISASRRTAALQWEDKGRDVWASDTSIKLDTGRTIKIPLRIDGRGGDFKFDSYDVFTWVDAANGKTFGSFEEAQAFAERWVLAANEQGTSSPRVARQASMTLRVKRAQPMPTPCGSCGYQVHPGSWRLSCPSCGRTEGVQAVGQTGGNAWCPMCGGQDEPAVKLCPKCGSPKTARRGQFMEENGGDGEECPLCSAAQPQWSPGTGTCSACGYDAEEMAGVDETTGGDPLFEEYAADRGGQTLVESKDAIVGPSETAGRDADTGKEGPEKGDEFGWKPKRKTPSGAPPAGTSVEVGAPGGGMGVSRRAQGYMDCACRDCFDTAINGAGQPVLCGLCEQAGCSAAGDQECQRDDASRSAQEDVPPDIEQIMQEPDVQCQSCGGTTFKPDMTCSACGASLLPGQEIIAQLDMGMLSREEYKPYSDPAAADKPSTVKCADCGTKFDVTPDDEWKCPSCGSEDVSSSFGAKLLAEYAHWLTADKSEYQKFVEDKAKEWGIDHPFDQPDEKVKDFFEEIDREWGHKDGARQAADKMSVECMECGKKFKTSSSEPKCPKCGSYDIDLAMDASRTAGGKDGARQAAEKVKVKCQECGKKFKVSPNNPGPRCPKCGGYDVEVDYDAAKDAPLGGPVSVEDTPTGEETFGDTRDGYAAALDSMIGQRRDRGTRYPCPTCGKPDAISAQEKAKGYQCRECTWKDEGGEAPGGWYDASRKTAQPIGMPPAAAGMTFERSNERSDGDRVKWDVAWDPEMVIAMSGEGIKNQIRSYVIRESSQRQATDRDRTRNWGFVGDVQVEDLDVDAGIATISFQTSEAAAPQVAPAQVTS